MEDIQFDKIKELTEEYILGTYGRFDLAFRYGVGELLFDTEEKQYIDFQSGIAVTNLGHSDPDILEAMRNQADRLFHTSNLFYSQEAAQLAEVLIKNSFPGKVFLCNSGTEANEAAFKLARKYAYEKQIDQPIILALKKSFHGRTFSAMSMTGQTKIQDGFGEMAAGIEYVDPNDEESLVHAFDKYSGRIVALIMEPILGEIGVIPITNSFATLARELTLENEALLIFDEIQTGIGRTGTLFAFEQFSFSPDAMTLAKGLGSGFPIGAIIIAEQYTHILGKGSHGSTFGGNHLAAAVAYETIRGILSREILKNVNEVSQLAFARLHQMQNKFSLIKEVRGKGLHIGIECKVPTRPIAEECLKRGLVINATADKSLRIMPPLSIRSEFMNQGLDILEMVLEKK